MAPQVCCLTIGFLCMATQVCCLTIGFLCMAPQMFMMETAEAWKRRKHGNGGSMETPEAWKRRKHGCATWYIAVVISLRDTPPAPHCAACILFSFRFAIPHQRRCVRRGEGFYFASRSPAHQPGGQNSDQQDRIQFARLIFLPSVLFSVTELGS